MSFASDLRRFRTKVERRTRVVHVEAAKEVLFSIQFGSAITGAPGQPVDLGTLLASWTLRSEGVLLSLISTNLVYAPPIEDGIGRGGALTLRSQVGGFHSVKLTRAGWPRIVRTVVRRVGD